MSRCPKLVIVKEPNTAEPESGRFLRLTSHREFITEHYHTICSVTLFHKIDDGPFSILYLATALHSEELVKILRDFRWSYDYIFMTAESAEDLLSLFSRPTVPIDVGDYKSPESVSEFKATLILD